MTVQFELKMDFKNLSPALPEKVSSEMSPTEFQQTLYAWFEEKGLVADLRSYLRLQMIKKLKNSSIGKPVEGQKVFSLSRQSFNLVIAEHLLRERYHYTLSVFSTELPKTNQLPFNLFESTHHEQWKFDEESALNIVDLIGISKCSREAVNIVEKYCSSNDISLLNCIITSKYSEKMETVEKVPTCNSDNVVVYLSEILTNIRVPSTVINNLISKVQQTVTNEQNKFELFNKKRDEKFDDLKLDIVRKDSEIRSLIDKQLLLNNENKEIKAENKTLKKQLSQALTTEEFYKKLELKTNCELKLCNESCEDNKTLIKQLQMEIVRLQELNKEKLMDIEKFQLQTSLLMADLKNSQSKIDFLNSCLTHSSQIGLEQRTGQVVKEAIILSDHSSDELTEDVLKQVRLRLQQLELESDQIDKKFRKLQMLS